MNDLYVSLSGIKDAATAQAALSGLNKASSTKFHQLTGLLDLLCDTFFARMERGGGRPIPTKLPYFPDQARELTPRYKRVVVAGTRRPVAFFGYPGLPAISLRRDKRSCWPGLRRTLGALSALAAQLHAPDAIGPVSGAPPGMPTGALDAQSVSAVIARLQPPNCIVMDEVLTVGVPYFDASKHAPRFTHLMQTGGAIGEGPALRPAPQSPVPTAR